MPRHKSHGRRRASVEEEPASPVPAHRARRYRAPNGHRSLAGVHFGVTSQKAAITVAVSGLAMTVIVPATGAVSPFDAGTLAAGAQTRASSGSAAPVTAAASASVTFGRANLGSSFDAEAKLNNVMLSAEGNLEPADARGSLAAPIESANLTSGFGYRINPLTGSTGEMHSGQDFGANCGAPVRAAADGVVIEAGWHAFGGGNRIVIDHGDGLQTTYNHLSSIDVQPGQSLSRGDEVAAAGTTGASTGCHLHFEVLVNGQAVDPLGWL